MNRVAPLAVLVVLAALGLAACGGGSGSSDEDQIRSISDRALTANDPATCEEIVTKQFIQNFYGGSIEQCKKNASETSDTPDSVDVADISVNGDKASAEITLVGGTRDGDKLAAIYVKEGSQWKFDGIAPASPHTDTTGTGASTGATATGTATTPSSGPLADLFFATIRSEIKKQGLSDQLADCIVAKLRTAITPQDLAALNAGTKPPDLNDKVRQAGIECGRQSLSAK